MTEWVHHIYVGMSNYKLWCGERLPKLNSVRGATERGVWMARHGSPITEGEFRDEVVDRDGVCEGCATALTNVRPT